MNARWFYQMTNMAGIDNIPVNQISINNIKHSSSLGYLKSDSWLNTLNDLTNI